MKTLPRALPFGLLLAASLSTGWAQTYPVKPVRLIVPFAPGGFTDLVARILGHRLSTAMGQQFIIDNRPGAGSIIGTEVVAKSPPDGYTLVMMSTTHVISPWIYKNLPYDPIKSFTVVSKLVDSPYVLLVNPKVQARNVQEFIALAKAAPGTLHYASSGNGSAQHLMGGLFVSLTGADLKHVPYKGSGGAATDLVAGVVESKFCRSAKRAGPGSAGTLESAGSHDSKTHSPAARCAHFAGSRCARLQRIGLARAAGAGRYAARHRHALEHRSCEADELVGDKKSLL